MAEPGKIIIVEGLSGSGKTTFCKSFVNSNPNAEMMEEWVDEKILSEYIADMPNKATFFQFEAQRQTTNKLKEAVELVKKGKIVLIDRGLVGNRCFAEVQYEAGFISDTDIISYREKLETVFDRISNEVMLETWYLRCEVDVALDRIRQRNRNGESSYSSEYLTKLKKKHDDLLLGGKEMDKNRGVKVVDVNRTLKVSSDGVLDVRCLIEVF